MSSTGGIGTRVLSAVSSASSRSHNSHSARLSSVRWGAGREPLRGGRYELDVGARVVDDTHPGEMAQAEQAPLDLAARILDVGLAEPLDLLHQVVHGGPRPDLLSKRGHGGVGYGGRAPHHLQFGRFLYPAQPVDKGLGADQAG